MDSWFSPQENSKKEVRLTWEIGGLILNWIFVLNWVIICDVWMWDVFEMNWKVFCMGKRIVIECKSSWNLENIYCVK